MYVYDEYISMVCTWVGGCMCALLQRHDHGWQPASCRPGYKCTYVLVTTHSQWHIAFTARYPRASAVKYPIRH